jgi:hypothetical protein
MNMYKSTDPRKGTITTKIRASLYHVLFSNTLLVFECNYINFLNIGLK